jgi:uracil-DNA glycosylase
MPFIEKYLGIKSIAEVNHTNVCFFRTPKIQYLKDEDWEISLPLFEKYVKYITPPWVFLIGNTGTYILETHGCLNIIKKITVLDKSRNVFGFKGLLFSQFDFFCVPHPQAHISTRARNNIWKKVTNSKIIKIM